MNVSKELSEKAKTAKTAEELLELAKAENIELTAEEAAKYFVDLHKSGELSDDELNNVAGGCATAAPKGEVSSPDQVVFLYEIGENVQKLNSYWTKTAKILDRRIDKSWLQNIYFPSYYIEVDSWRDWITQDQLEKK